MKHGIIWAKRKPFPEPSATGPIAGGTPQGSQLEYVLPRNVGSNAWLNMGSTPPGVLELAEGEWDRAGKAPCDAIKQYFDSTSTSAYPEPE
jgi:hypothetical protein